jgi:hypothetical protein
MGAEVKPKQKQKTRELMSPHKWIGVDFDGTLATETSWDDDFDAVGEPIAPMIERVKRWLAAGKDVRIVTARVADDWTAGGWARISAHKDAIRKFCAQHLGQVLEIQAHKDFQMAELWDDRAVRVVRNTGAVSDQQEKKDE